MNEANLPVFLAFFFLFFFLYHEEPDLNLTQYKEPDPGKVSVLIKKKDCVKDLVKLTGSLIS